MKLKEQVLQAWTNLKPKLTQLTFFTKNKDLIKEAIEFHKNQASSFTTIHAYPEFLARAKLFDYRTIPKLAILSAEEQENLSPEERNNIISRAYDIQMIKSKKIVEQCKELLEKLKDERNN